MVIHEREVLMPDDSPDVRNLCDVTSAITEVWPTPVSDLVDEHYNATCWVQVGGYQVFPFSAFEFAWIRFPQQV